MLRQTPNRLVVSVEECQFFITRAVEKMVGIVEELGDNLANRRPGMRGTNSPYQILTHCLGVLDYWAGSCIAGRQVSRDRDAEFTARGKVADLAARATEVVAQANRDVETARPQEPLRVGPQESWDPTDVERSFTQSEALLHIVEELYQHLGQLEVTRDLLRAA